MPLYAASQVTTTLTTSSTCKSSTVVSAIASTLILAANPSRLFTSITNNTTKTLYLDFGGAASATDYAVAVPKGALYELPLNFTGAIHGIWSAVDGVKGALVREFV